MLSRSCLLLGAVLLSGAGVWAQQGGLRCVTSAVPPTVHAEGLTEAFGDVDLSCTGGTPNGTLTANLSVFLNTNVTNRLGANNTVDVQLLADPGTGLQAVAVPAVLSGQSMVTFTGVTAPLSNTGSVSLTIRNLRGVASQAGFGSPLPIVALISSNSLFIDNPQVFIASPQPSIAETIQQTIIGCNYGAPLPASPDLAMLYSSGAFYSAARVTEKFGDAFQKKSATADTGTRIIVQFNNLPAGVQLYVPDEVAGSDALQPSVSGAFGGSPNGGQYQPASQGTLLLVRVLNTDANGAGGTLAYTPGAPGSAVVSFNNVSPVSINSGASTGMAVYEVVDSNPAAIESAQIVTFIGLAPNPNSAVPSYTIGGSVSLGPLSTVNTADPTAPIPRFTQSPAASDCGLVGDCTANYYPSLFVDSPALTYNLVEKAGFQRLYFRVYNQNAGPMPYTISVQYQGSATGWLRIFPLSGLAPATVDVDAITTQLAPGNYTATITVDAGMGGSVAIPVTLTVTAANPQPIVFSGTIASVGNAASFTGPVVAGSLATIMGTGFGSTTPTVTFDGLPATVLFSNATQINLEVPASLAGKQTSQLVITMGGVSSQAIAVPVASYAPGIFHGGIANEDNTANSAAIPAQPGSVLQVYATGVLPPSMNGFVEVHLNDKVLTPLYAGVAPGLPGVQQVNFAVPLDFTGAAAQVSICSGYVSQYFTGVPVCSAPVSISLSK